MQERMQEHNWQIPRALRQAGSRLEGLHKTSRFLAMISGSLGLSLETMTQEPGSVRETLPLVLLQQRPRATVIRRWLYL
jgi:hypothetical protein